MRKARGIDARIGERVRRLRDANGMSREQLAERAGRSVSFLAKLELGSGRGRLETWERIARALGTTLSELFADDPPYVAGGVAAREAPGRRYGVSDDQLSALALHARSLDQRSFAALVTIARQMVVSDKK